MSTSTFDVLNPATEEIIETVPLATLEETDRAIEKAVVAFETWRHVSPADRACCCGASPLQWMPTLRTSPNSK
jgi:acyl-CoA reductase-like NAD-dependent aldehyde dehydrogenase